MSQPAISDSKSATEIFRTARDFLLTHREDYATAYTGFQWPRLERFNWALDWFDQIAAGERGSQTALWVVYEDGRQDKLSFAELSERSNRFASYYRSLGVKRGDRVLLMLGNIPPLWETMLAMMKLGAVIIPATTLLTANDVADRIARGRVRHVVCAAELAPKVEQACGSCTRVAIGGTVPGWHEYQQGYNSPANFEPEGETEADDPLQLYFTSGTTAKPKLVMHSHTSYPVGHLSTMYWIGIRPGDIHCNLSSPGWAKHAWSCFFAPWNAEATVFVINQSRFSARGLLDAITGCGVTTFCAPPTVWRMLITERLNDWKVRLRELASAGELCLPLDERPAGLMPGYQGDDGILIPLQSPVYRTGDVVQRDAEGYLTFVGRSDDVFKASDYRISPFEVESALIEHPDVVECAVVPSPDPVRHALVKAFVTLRLGCAPSRETALSIFQHSRKVLAPYKRVRRLEFVDLPKTISGKIRRVQLRTAEAERGPEQRPEEFREEEFGELK